MTENKLFRAADRAVNQALRIRKGEKYLLVTDTQKLEIAEALAFCAKRAGAEVTTYLMTETLRPITGPTRQFKTLIEGATVTTYLLEGRFAEKPFRGFMVAQGSRHGRICMMPGITRDMMERLVAIDFSEMAAFTKRVIRAVKDAEIEVENAAGTKIAFSVKGRAWHDDVGNISKKGVHGNLPAGECFTAPVEGTFTGRIAIGLIDDQLGPGEMTFRAGRLIGFKGAGIAEVIKTVGDDPTARTIGEFGIGTNKGARICPNMLEAEKAFGTVHFAIGDSYGIGKNKSKFHFDALVDKVTIRADGKLIAKDGKFLL
jgi:leucyl aminopeptidase (aminopeptidase T)